MDIYYLTLTVVFIFGTFIGSFLNVLILRHNTGKTLLGRSGCMSCRKSLGWAELVPVLSYVLQRGRCKGCRSHVSLQYPIVELLTGVMFALAFLTSDSTAEILFSTILFSVLIVIVVYDMRHKIIPDRYVWTFVLLGVLTLFVDLGTLTLSTPSLTEVLAGPIVALPLFLLWVVSGGRWIGLGDSKVALAIGFFLGIGGGLVALMLSFWIGAAYGISIMIAQKLHTYHRLNKGKEALTMKSEVPFAPFLILGFLLIYMFPQTFLDPIISIYLF